MQGQLDPSAMAGTAALIGISAYAGIILPLKCFAGGQKGGKLNGLTFDWRTCAV